MFIKRISKYNLYKNVGNNDIACVLINETNFNLL